jgi:hypothetical protein
MVKFPHVDKVTRRASEQAGKSKKNKKWNHSKLNLPYSNALKSLSRCTIVSSANNVTNLSIFLLLI